MGSSGAGKEESKLVKASRDRLVSFNCSCIIYLSHYTSCKTGIEAVHGLMLQVIKDNLFNQTK